MHLLRREGGDLRDDKRERKGERGGACTKMVDSPRGVVNQSWICEVDVVPAQHMITSVSSAEGKALAAGTDRREEGAN